jgi:hypothetical protein
MTASRYSWYQSLYWSLGWAALHEVERMELAAHARAHRRCCDFCKILGEGRAMQRRADLMSELIRRFDAMLDGREAILYGDPLR